MSTSCRKAPVWTRAIALLAAFTFMLPAAIGQDSGTAVESSTIKGKITTGPKKTPVPGATVLVYHLATATIHRSTPTDGESCGATSWNIMSPPGATRGLYITKSCFTPSYV